MRLRICGLKHLFCDIFIAKTTRFVHHHPHFGCDVGFVVEGELGPVPLAEVTVAVAGLPEEGWFGGGCGGGGGGRGGWVGDFCYGHD